MVAVRVARAGSAALNRFSISGLTEIIYLNTVYFWLANSTMTSGTFGRSPVPPFRVLAVAAKALYSTTMLRYSRNYVSSGRVDQPSNV